MSKSITFDFHNTLIECDEWFQIEIRTLVSDVLRYWHDLGEIEVPPQMLQAADLEYRRLRQAIHVHGHELPADRSVRTILERIGFVLPWNAIDIALDAIMRNAFRHARPVAGAPETVRLLADHEIQLGVVSSAVHHDFLIWSLERYAMLEAFQEVITSASCGFYKSRPEIYWSAMADLGASPAESLHIGDSLRFDVGGAARAGMRTAWYQRPNARETISPELSPDITVRSMDGVAPILLTVLERS
ncbi:MAG: HAD family hydrolase [Thermomicrobiales bacterium]